MIMEKKNKLRIVLAVCVVLLGVAILTESIFTYPYLPHTLGLTLIITGATAFLFSITMAVALDYVSGDYECRQCGHRFVPTLGAYIWAIHTPTTRRLKCPKCGKKTFCKRKLG